MTEVIASTIHRVMHEIKRRRLEVLRVVDLTRACAGLPWWP